MYSYLDEAIREGLILESAIATPCSVEENIRRGTDAMRHVIASHKIEPRAMYRKDIGWIGFEWGTEGEAPPEFKDHAEFRKWQKSGHKPFDKGGHGIAHIIAKRNWEGEHIEEFLGQKGIEVAYKLIQVISPWQSPNSGHYSPYRVAWIFGNFEEKKDRKTGILADYRL